jgi:hypothetical protein
VDHVGSCLQQKEMAVNATSAGNGQAKTIEERQCDLSIDYNMEGNFGTDV